MPRSQAGSTPSSACSQMASEPIFSDGWFRFTSATEGREGKGVLLHADDFWSLHEGEEPGTMLIEFDPALDRVPETVFMKFDSFIKDYVGCWDARGRRPHKRKRPAKAGPRVVRLNTSK